MCIIKIATTKAEKSEIFKFRYRVYINELNKHFLLTSQGDEELKDNLDRKAINIYSEKNGQVIACMRCTLQKFDDRLCNRFGITLLSENIIYAQLDRFMLHPDYRGTRIAANYMNWIYKFGLTNNVQIALIEVEENLISLYKAIGFIPYRTTCIENDPKEVRIQMYLNMNNYSHLSCNHSLLAKQLSSHLEHIDASFLRISRLQSA